MKTSSRFLSLVLRHKPHQIGLELDAGGWVRVDQLLSALHAHGREMSEAELNHIVASNNKQRFTIAAGRIRANQGHSIAIDLDLEPTPPPACLYHGTVARYLDAIRREGLQKMTRHHVHLSTDQASAALVGQRRGEPVVLTVKASQMHADGIEFFVSANDVWLVDEVLPTYIEFP